MEQASAAERRGGRPRRWRRDDLQDARDAVASIRGDGDFESLIIAALRAVRKLRRFHRGAQTVPPPKAHIAAAAERSRATQTGGRSGASRSCDRLTRRVPRVECLSTRSIEPRRRRRSTGWLRSVLAGSRRSSRVRPKASSKWMVANRPRRRPTVRASRAGPRGSLDFANDHTRGMAGARSSSYCAAIRLRARSARSRMRPRRSGVNGQERGGAQSMNRSRCTA